MIIRSLGFYCFTVLLSLQFIKRVEHSRKLTIVLEYSKSQIIHNMDTISIFNFLVFLLYFQSTELGTGGFFRNQIAILPIFLTVNDST